MNDIQVLVATMHQSDTSIAKKMNITCGAVIANQADREEIVNEPTEFGALKMITTATRGVGLNRNIALLAAESEIVLFADDDVVYNNGMPEAVVNAFRENKDADVIIFSMDITKNGQVTEKRHLRKRRLHVWNSMRFGTYTIAAKRESLIKKGIFFNQFFGGGCMYGSGEDSLFIKSCFDKGLRLYSHSYVLGTCCKDQSSWFKGCDEKYFYDKGALMRHLFPRIPYIMAAYFSVRFKKKTDILVFNRLRLMLLGVRGGKSYLPYQQ